MNFNKKVEGQIIEPIKDNLRASLLNGIYFPEETWIDSYKEKNLKIGQIRSETLDLRRAF